MSGTGECVWPRDGVRYLLLLTTILAAYQTSPVPPSPSSVPPSPIPSQEAASEAISSPEAAWGPLAVADDDAQGGLDAGLGPGSLIGPRCVTLLVDEIGREITLIWRSGQTRWDPLAGEIVFRDRDLGGASASRTARGSCSGARAQLTPTHQTRSATANLDLAA